MNTIYNTQEEIASNIKNFLLKTDKNIRKTQLKIIPYIILGMILSESTVASDISKNLKGDFSNVKYESVIKRIKRLFSNKLFDSHQFYNNIIKYVISTYKKKHNDKKIHLIFDHMFSHDNYTIFMISMRVGKQGIPLWFKCFKGKNDSNAFDESIIKEGISYVSSLFDSHYDLIFLADRWFNSTAIMNHIDNLRHTYCIRLKKNLKILCYDSYKKQLVWKNTGDITSQFHHAKYLNDVFITDKKYKCNIAISKSMDVSEPWIIVTNGDSKRAIKDYRYRFGGIECIFKNQKSNGLYMESTVNASLKYFTNMYTLACVSTLFLTLFGADYSKNSNCYKNIKLTTHKKFKTGIKRVMSLFNIGLTLFKLAFNSPKYIRIPFNFILYDV